MSEIYYPVSIFRTAFVPVPEVTASIYAVFDEIKSPDHRQEIESLRACVARGAIAEYNEKKKRLNAFCVSGVCKTRAASVPLEEKFVSHSGFLQADLDLKDNPQLADLDAVRELMRSDPYVAAYFVSPSGNGLKVIVRVPPSLEKHRASWDAANKRFFEKYGLKIDKSTKDPLRLCFMSYDPDLWVRDTAAKELPPLEREKPQVYYGKQERTTTESDIEEMLRYVPARPAYEDWLRIASAVWSVLPFEAGTTLLNRWSPEEKPGEYTAKWKNRLQSIGIGTLVHYAKQGGFDAVLAARRKQWCGRVYFGNDSAGTELKQEQAEQRIEDSLRREDVPEDLDADFIRTALGEAHVGMARIFCAKMRGKIVFDHKINLWRRYNRGVWERDETGETRLEFVKVCSDELMKLIAAQLDEIRDDPAPAGTKDARLKQIDSIRKGIENINKKKFIEDSLSIASSMLASVATEFDANPYLAACENGTLDLNLGDFREHSPADKITLRFPVNFNIEATAPKWEEFVNSIFDGNTETIRYVQRAVGYSLSGLTNEDALFFLIGAGANGKSVFRSALEMLFGAYRSEISIGALLTTTSDSNVDYQKARLKGSRLAFTDEVPENKRFNESQIKAITGRDTILARNPYEKPYSFQPTHKLWLIGNHKPTITGTDNGIWRRINIIPFNVIFSKEKQIKPSQFHAWFRAELPGILNWALKGWLDYQANGLQPPAEVINATNEYRSEQDQIGAFVEETLMRVPGSRIKTGTLFQMYSDWARENGELLVCRTKNKMTMKLKELGYEIEIGKGRASFLSGYVAASESAPTLHFADPDREARYG